MIVLGAFTDRDRFLRDYQTAVAPLIRRFGGEYILVGRDLLPLETDFPGGGGAVVSKWPSRAAALSFWNSPEYAEVKKLRAGTGQFQVVLVDG
jgi:uncharacterized protein (DUF1330 family)